MELPKNIVQIGEPDKVHKIYVEDYIFSYMKQLNRTYDGKAAGIALYGRENEENGCRYYFLYGAAKVPGLEERGEYLTQAEQEEIAAIGNKYFEDQDFLGWCSVKDELVESIYVMMQGKGVAVNGYACFYEKNESMLNYMLLHEELPKNRDEEEEKRTDNKAEKKADAPGIANRVKVSEIRERQKKKVPGRTGILKIAAAAVFLSLLVVGITAMNGYDKMEDLQVAASQVIAQMSEQKLPSLTPAPAGEKLADGEGKGTADSAGKGLAVSDAGNGQKTSDAQENALKQENAESSAFVAQTPAPAAEKSAEEEKSVQTQGPAEVRGEPLNYTVVKGDTLLGICRQRYGSTDRIHEICELNNIKNADDIKVGQIILLP